MVGLKFIAHLLELCHRLIGQYRELLIGGGGHREGISQGRDTVPEPEGQLVGAAGQVEVEPVLQQGLELESQQPALGQHGAPLLHVPAEVRHGTGEHQRLPEEGAVFRAADGEGVGEGGQLRQCQVVVGGGEGGAQPGAVQIEEQAVNIAALPQGGQLRPGVDRADLRGVGDVHHSGQHHVLRAVVARQNGLDQGRGQLAVRALHGADLVSGGLDGAGLMGADVAGLGGDHRLIGLQKRVDGDEVHLRPAHQEVNRRIRRGAEAADGIRRGLAAGIHAVAHGLPEVGVRQGLEDLGMGALAVIVSETVHCDLPPFSL